MKPQTLLLFITALIFTACSSPKKSCANCGGQSSAPAPTPGAAADDTAGSQTGEFTAGSGHSVSGSSFIIENSVLGGVAPGERTGSGFQVEGAPRGKI